MPSHLRYHKFKKIYNLHYMINILELKSNVPENIIIINQLDNYDTLCLVLVLV